jgi:hypothetical protein
MSTIPETDSVLPNVILNYEHALFGGNDPVEATLEAIRKVSAFSGDKGSLLLLGVPENQKTHWLTRLASAFTYFVGKASTITHVNLAQLACFKSEFVSIFTASGYGSTKHIKATCALGFEDTEFKYDSNTILLILMMTSINDLDTPLLKFAAGLPPKIYFVLSMGWLNERSVITELGETNRTFLLENSEAYQNESLNQYILPAAHRTWMYSSYAETPKKHNIKQTLNRMIVRYCNEVDCRGVNPKSRKMKDKPTVLVIHEFFQKTHAMYRCYAPRIRALKHDFNLVALADEKVIDKKDREIFGYIKSGNYDQMSLKEIEFIIKKIAPDIIIYPSVGMRWWVVCMANLRLAPIQIACLGHPATTKSESIDYVYVANHEGDLESMYSERILVSPKCFHPEPHPLQEHALSELECTNRINKDSRINIAINAKVMKLSYRLLTICSRLEKKYEGRLSFHFFPGERGLGDDGIQGNIRSVLTNAIIYPSLPYIDFIRNLNQADFCLSAFPFGNTNSTVDACVLGKPVIAKYGAEMAAQSDALVLDAAQYPEWLVTRSDDEFFLAATKLIDELIEGKDIKRHLNGARNISEISIAGNNLNRHLSDFVKHCYREHESISSSNKRVLHWDEIKHEYC